MNIVVEYSGKDLLRVQMDVLSTTRKNILTDVNHELRLVTLTRSSNIEIWSVEHILLKIAADQGQLSLMEVNCE